MASAWAAEPPSKADFYVAPNGNDDNPGTESAPFATLWRARGAVRYKIAAGLGANVTVLIREGTYQLDAPLTFGPADSGTEKHSITYAAYPDEKVVISGGRRITGWKRGAGNLWTVELPDVKAGNWYFRQLFVNGRRAIRARTPNLDDASPYAPMAQLQKLVMERKWQNLPDMESVGLNSWEITRVYGGLAPSLWGYLENAIEMLDRPQEWYLDRRTGTLYYWSPADLDMTSAEVVAPALTRLMEVKGTADRPVRNLHFRGLQFAYADWLLPAKGYAGVQACFFKSGSERIERVDEAIRWEFTELCSLTDSQIAHVGGGGLSLRRGCSHNIIQGNIVNDIGANGIMVGEMSDVPSETPRNNRIANNHIYRCGVDYPGAVGLWVGFTDGTVVAHNLLHDLPYTGISVGWRWDATPTSCKNNRIEYNHVYDVMKLLSDGGGIYLLGFQPGTVLRGNVVHDVKRSDVASGGSCNGIYLDDGSKGYLIEGNVVYGVNGSYVSHKSDRGAYTWRDNSFGVQPYRARLVKGKIGYGIALNGIDESVEVPHSPSLEPSSITVEAWIYLSSFPAGGDTRRWIINKNGNEWTEGHYALLIDHDSVGAYVNLGGGQQNCYGAWSPKGALTLHRWQHVAMTYDGASLKVYLNGEMVGTTSVHRRRKAGGTPLVIGRRQDGGFHFSGVVDEIRLYNRTLTQAELKAHYTLPAPIVPKSEKGLVAFWDFDHSSINLSVPGFPKSAVDKAGLEPPYRKKLLESGLDQ